MYSDFFDSGDATLSGNSIKHTEREKKPILPDVSFGAKSEIYKPCIQSRR